jgi:putative heme-binding domain-containing protein
LEHRLRVLNWLADVRGDKSVEDLNYVAANPKTAQQYVNSLWLLHRIGKLRTDFQTEADINNPRMVGVHVMNIVGEIPEWTWRELNAAWIGQTDDDPWIARAASGAIARHPRPHQFSHLLDRLHSVAIDDDLLRYSLRAALRDNLAVLKSVDEVRELQLSPQELELLVSVAIAVNTTVAAEVLLDHLSHHDVSRDLQLAYLQHTARNLPVDRSDSLIQLARRRLSGDVEVQKQLLDSIYVGLSQKGKERHELLIGWGEELANHLLGLDKGDQIPWTAIPIEGLPPSENPWVLQQRASQDGDKESMFFCSIVKGEQRTGIYRSAAFELPAKLSFWCAGHDGFPTVKLQGKNLVRLRDAKTHEILASSPPPRNDTAQKIEWDLTKHAGKQGYAELVDGDTAGAFAWLAVGRFSIEGLNPSKRTEHLIAAADIVGKLKLHSLRAQLAELLVAASTDGAARAAIGQALVAIDPDGRAAALVAALNDPSISDALRVKIGAAIAGRDAKTLSESLTESMKILPLRMQTSLAETLAGDAAGADSLIALVKAGVASPRLLASANVKAKLDALKSDKVTEQVAAITDNLPAASEIIDKLVIERRAAYPRAKPDLQKGTALFEKHCAACHQIAGKGSVIGPQLDGIGLRGLERLVEDVLDPNRNVDVAFRTTTIRTMGGEVISGLVRREEGATLILADNKGKEFSVPKSDIDEQAKGSLSLMPANVHEIVSEQEFYDLLAFLLGQKQAKEPAK